MPIHRVQRPIQRTSWSRVTPSPAHWPMALRRGTRILSSPRCWTNMASRYSPRPTTTTGAAIRSTTHTRMPPARVPPWIRGAQASAAGPAPAVSTTATVAVRGRRARLRAVVVALPRARGADLPPALGRKPVMHGPNVMFLLTAPRIVAGNIDPTALLRVRGAVGNIDLTIPRLVTGAAGNQVTTRRAKTAAARSVEPPRTAAIQAVVTEARAKATAPARVV